MVKIERTVGELFEGLVSSDRLEALRERRVTGVFDDSRRVTPNGVFVALRGSKADGRQFAAAACERGAALVVGEDLPAFDATPVINVTDARSVLAKLAARWFGLTEKEHPGFKVAGVTGTNGKSTTAFMTRAIVRAAGRKCGLLGTVQYDLCSRTVTANMTTPGPLELTSYLRACADAGAASAVMEVSSHALDQRRTDGIRFAAAAFTNLTGDHLDYHVTMENYRDAKARLFRGLDESAVAIVNADDPHHSAMIEGSQARVMRYSLQRVDVEIVGVITRETIKGSHFVMRIEGRELAIENAIPGRHNVYNAMAAAGLARGLDVPFESIASGLASVRNVPGRLQRVPGSKGFEVFVDYAHTDDALDNVLRVLRGLTKRRLICVFGCGGDRDKTKRPRMGRVVAMHADAIVVTSDNPRTEHPESIIADILAGIEGDARRRTTVEPDRRRAIRGALAAASEGDVVLIAGKGHEDYQEIADRRIHFDDVEVAIEALAALAADREH